MSGPVRGRADYLELGDWNAACAECGRKRKASQMRQLPVGVPGGSMWVCYPEHWNPRQPQDYVRGIPDKMAAPWQQNQVDEYTYQTYNYDASSDEEEVELDNNSDVIINVFGGVTLDLLTIATSGTGSGLSVRINVYGYIAVLDPGVGAGSYDIQIFPGGGIGNLSGIVGVGIVGNIVVGGITT